MSVFTLPDAQVRHLTVRAKAVVFEDPASQELLQRVRAIAPSDATVLITGETGTGKEIVARQIHAQSARADRPFVAVNCGALSEALIESELFGHEKGAFTGAVTTSPGWFETANAGTIFLDEVGDLPLPLQVKLLRVLQEREVVRLGSRQPIPVDVRLIAATNVNLEQAVAARKFREDLYYRLRVAVVSLRPLRERPGDIVPLAQYFLELYRRRLGAGAVRLGAEASRRLVAHDWRGNIRELENVIHAALLVCRNDEIGVADLNLGIPPAAAPCGPQALAHDEEGGTTTADALAPLRPVFRELFEREPPDLHAAVEAELVLAAFEHCDRNQLRTARLLGVTRNVLRARLQQAGALAGGRRTKVPPELRTVSPLAADAVLPPPRQSVLRTAAGRAPDA